jgi:adenine-specific DNA-methyltransferase
MSEKPLSTPLLHTPSPAAHKLELLRQLFPQAVQTDPDGSVRVDAAQIQRALDPANAQGIRVEETGYELRWVGKQEAYHTAFARTDKIVAPLPADSKAWDSTGNLLIQGDNLDALKLLRQSYFGQVKLIYIDPPYNTKSDEFIYRDDFTARQTDILAQLGYSADNVEYIQNIYGARTHSGWLSFMYPRLLLAKDLLRDDGVIFISIDDNEQAQLKLLCDEVFGQDNFVGELALLCNPKGRSQDKYFATNHEYVLAYSKSILDKGSLSVEKDAEEIEANYDEVDEDGERYRLLELRNTHREFGRHNRKNLYYPFYVNDEGDVTLFPLNGEIKVVPDWDDGFEGCWTWDRTKAEKDISLLTGKQIKGKWKIYRKSYANGANRMLKTILHDKSFYTEKGQKELNTLLETRSKIFPSPKSPWLISALAQTSTESQDLILDFFAGSGTTGEAVMRLNAEDGGQRQFILVQIPQPIDPKKQKEAYSFVTQTLGKPEATIFEITAERLRRAGDKINAAQRSQGKPEVDAGFRVYTLTDDPHALVHRTRLDQATQADVAALQTAIATPQPEQRPVVLANLLLTEGLPLSATLTPLAAGGVADALWQAQDTLLVLDAVPLDALVDLLRQRKAAGTPVHHVSVYAPWVHDDNFLQGVQTLLEAEGFSADRLRLRG